MANRLAAAFLLIHLCIFTGNLSSQEAQDPEQSTTEQTPSVTASDATDQGVRFADLISAISIGVNGAWTGNGYKPDPTDPGGIYDFSVTGSESFPIDYFLSGGIRMTLVQPFLGSAGALAFTPLVEIGARRYLLFENGRVVPTQEETALGDDENNNPGLGSARVLTIRAMPLVTYELTFANRTAIVMGISPTLLLRIRAGDIEVQTDRSDLRGMYSFFYGRLRFLMPEVHLGFRFPLSEFFEATLYSEYGVSILDLFDASLPWYDQMRVEFGVRFDLIPPLGGMLRPRDPDIDVPELADEQPSEE